MKDHISATKQAGRSKMVYKGTTKNELFNATINPLLQSLTAMFQNSKYEYIKDKYNTNKLFKDKGNMDIVKNLLACEASFISSTDFKLTKKATDKEGKRMIEDTDLFPKATEHHEKLVNNLFSKYSRIKMRYIEDNKNNMFY
jgi:hypothetical protein